MKRLYRLRPDECEADIWMSVPSALTIKPLTDIDVAVGVGDACQLVLLVFAARVVRWPVPVGAVIKEVIRPAVFQPKRPKVEVERSWRVAMTLLGYILHHVTVHRARPPIDQTSGALVADDPVVDVGLNHELVPKLPPQVERHGVVIGLAGGSLCRDRYISLPRPVRAWRDSVRRGTETVVVCERVTVH